MSHAPLTALASVADVEVRTDMPISPEQQARPAILLDDVSAMVRRRDPILPDLPPATAPGMVCTAVLRTLASPPDGNKFETVDGHSRTAAVNRGEGTHAQ